MGAEEEEHAGHVDTEEEDAEVEPLGVAIRADTVGEREPRHSGWT